MSRTVGRSPTSCESFHYGAEAPSRVSWVSSRRLTPSRPRRRVKNALRALPPARRQHPQPMALRAWATEVGLRSTFFGAFCSLSPSSCSAPVFSLMHVRKSLRTALCFPEREFPVLLVVWAYQKKHVYFWKRAVFFPPRVSKWLHFLSVIGVLPGSS